MASIYAGIDQKGYDNESKYLNNLINSGTAGQKAWAQSQMKELNANKPAVQPTQTTQQSAGSAIASSKPAQTQTSKPASTGSTNAFTTPGSQVADSGTQYLSWGENDQYKVKDYLSGNADLQYALEQYMKDNNTNVYDIEGYAKDMYNRVGTQRADGSVVTLDDVNKELDRLGLSDYNSQNVTHTAGGSLIPNNEFVTNKTGGFGTNSEDSEWLSYGDRDYLVGGDSANFVDYVNGKTGNTTNLDYLFDDMANNPYAKEDAEFAQMYQNALNQFNGAAGIQTPIQVPTTVTGGSYTGLDKVDQFIDYVNSVNGFNQATGGTAGTGSDIWSEIKAMLQGGYESQQDFLANQRTQAEQNAENLMRQAYVNQRLQGDRVKEALYAAGLGTSGAMQSAMLGVQGNYNNNVADIRANLNQMLSNFSEQELKALTDYMDKSTNYYYQIRNDEADIAKQNAQMYLQMLEMQQAQEQKKWENLYKQQLLELENQQYKNQWDWEQKQYEDALKQQAFENELAWNELLLAQQKASGKNNGSGINPVSPTVSSPQQQQENFSLTPTIAYGGTTGNTIRDYQANQNTRDGEMAYALYQSGLLDDSVNVGMLSVMSNGALEYALQHAKDEVLRDMPVEVARAWIAQKLS